jgi:hypothetical protein
MIELYALFSITTQTTWSYWAGGVLVRPHGPPDATGVALAIGDGLLSRLPATLVTRYAYEVPLTSPLSVKLRPLVAASGDAGHLRSAPRR